MTYYLKGSIEDEDTSFDVQKLCYVCNYWKQKQLDGSTFSDGNSLQKHGHRQEIIIKCINTIIAFCIGPDSFGIK